MSDIGRRAHLQRSAAQLPVSAYFDEALHQRELEILFRNGPGYIGHELIVPNTGDYFALPAEKEGRLLVRGEQGIELLSNVCRHRQSVMLNGRGNAGNIVCPLHRWTYDLEGRLLGAPHFEQQPCLNLGRSPLQNWNGLLFSGKRDVAADLERAGVRGKLNFSGYMLDHVEVHECAYNWKSFIEVYLEDYHVEPFHPGLGKFVECDDLNWEFGDWWSTSLGTLFDRTDFVLIDPSDVPQVTSAARAIRFWDLAATEPSSSNPDPDWTVGTLMLFDQGIAYVLDVRRIRARGEKVEQLIAQTAYEDGHAVSIRMEQEPGSSGKALIDQYARYVLPGYDLIGMRASGDKVTRARPFAAAVANGNVRVVRGTWLTDWLDEFASFPEARVHDDQVDSAVGAFTYLAGLGLPQRKKVAIII